MRPSLCLFFRHLLSAISTAALVAFFVVFSSSPTMAQDDPVEIEAPPDSLPSTLVDALKSGRVRVPKFSGGGKGCLDAPRGFPDTTKMSYDSIPTTTSLILQPPVDDAIRNASDVDFPSPDTLYYTRVHDCEAFLRRIRALYPTRTIGSPPHQIRITIGRISHGDSLLTEIDGECQHTDPCTGYRRNYQLLLSVVGPFVTWRNRHSVMPGINKPYHGTTWTSVDLRTSRQPHLTDVFTDASVLNALAKDAHVNKEMPPEIGELIRNVSTVDALIDSLQNRDRGMFEEQALESLYDDESGEVFAVYDYRPESGRAAIRIPFYPRPETLRAPSLGLWVTVRPKWRDVFARAKRNDELLMTSPGIPRDF